MLWLDATPGFAQTPGSPTPPARVAEAEHERAVDLARRGDTATALAILDRLHRERPGDLAVARDLIVVSGWAGHDAAAIRLYHELPGMPEPDFVLEALGRAYRDLGKAAEALGLYREALRRSPANEAFAAGEIRTLVDVDRAEEALTRADADLRAHGERVAVLLAAGYAAQALDKPVDALRYCDRALAVAPTNRDALHDRIVAIDRMGAPQVALRLSDAHPGALSPAERRRIEGDEAAALVRWGPLDPPSEAERFAMTDRAIAALDGLIRRWSADPAAHDDVLRARFDRMVALRDRVRMADVLAEYDDLLRAGVEIPGYALAAVADAYLYFRQPEKARDLYRRVLATDPRNPEVRLGLFYAYVELDDFDAAYHQADAMRAAAQRWIYRRGLPVPLPNPDRITADLSAASARLYADDLAEAERRFEAMADAAPNNARYRASLANIYTARGWPRRAAEQYEIGLALLKPDLGLEAGQARNNLDLRAYRAVDTETADLMRRFPENLEVQRLDRLWQVHNMAELRVDVEQDFRSKTDVAGGTGLTIDTRIYTPPIDYNWRLFGGELIAHEQLPPGEGQITLKRSSAGAEYRDPDWLATFEGTFNIYRQQDPVLGSFEQDRGGAHVAATRFLDDHWQVGVDGELFSRDTPLRALRSGVTADAGGINLAYRESESREIRFDAQGMTFSDGNDRTSATGRYTERLLTTPYLHVDGLVEVAESHDSEDANRLYYNPRQDALGTAGVEITQTLYHRYELIYDHQLVVTPGAYWEQGFGTSAAFAARYQHRLRVNDVIDTALGVGYGRQNYDGIVENTISVLFNMTARF
ncbi:MAG TPA: poly-beta-1,6 N-acetyl-D-glucosamine export porin PgaA [Candidatus Sulfotelmatobacter sp.]|nr:poly-beta-1,6 N-acetyl-D-glucosamine export porin PgaA [Candidatus Sulfotelmatobacter sp.]